MPIVLAPLVLGAAWCFIGGYRFGFTPARALARGSIVAALIAAPIWGWTASTVMRWVHLAPTDADAQIAGGYVGGGGRFAFVDYQHGESVGNGKGHAIRVDLLTGEWREMGGYGHSFENAGGVDRSTWLTGGTALQVLLLLEDTVHDRHEWVDASTGEILDEPFDRVKERVRASKRATTPLRLDHHRAWFQDGALEIEEGAGGYSVATQFGATHVSWSDAESHGPVLLRHSGNNVEVVPLDLYRGRTVEKQELGEGWRCEYVLPSGWLVRAEPAPTPRDQVAPERPWFLQDPASGKRTLLTCLGPDEWLFAVHDDGRVWTIEEKDPRRHTGRLLLVDVTTGTCEEIACSAIAGGDFCGLLNPGWPMAPARTPGGARVYGLSSRDGRHVLARFEEQTHTLVPALGILDQSLPTCFLALPDEGSAIFARDQRTIVRVHFGSDACEVLFPRDR
jgi:hypothetical protein